MKRFWFLCIVLWLLLSALLLSASASMLIKTEHGTVIWDGETTKEVLLDMEKVYHKEYTQEKLNAYVQYTLSRMRVVGEILVYAKTDNAEATTTEISGIVGENADYSYTQGSGTLIYLIKMNETDLEKAMLELLENGFYVIVNSVTFPKDHAPFWRGDLDMSGEVNTKDYLMLKRIVLGSYDLNTTSQLLADVDGDGKINAKDYLITKRHVLGTFEIKYAALIDLLPDVE